MDNSLESLSMLYDDDDGDLLGNFDVADNNDVADNDIPFDILSLPFDNIQGNNQDGDPFVIEAFGIDNNQNSNEGEEDDDEEEEDNYPYIYTQQLKQVLEAFPQLQQMKQNKSFLRVFRLLTDEVKRKRSEDPLIQFNTNEEVQVVTYWSKDPKCGEKTNADTCNAHPLCIYKDQTCQKASEEKDELKSICKYVSDAIQEQYKMVKDNTAMTKNKIYEKLVKLWWCSSIEDATPVLEIPNVFTRDNNGTIKIDDQSIHPAVYKLLCQAYYVMTNIPTVNGVIPPTNVYLLATILSLKIDGNELNTFEWDVSNGDVVVIEYNQEKFRVVTDIDEDGTYTAIRI